VVKGGDPPALSVGRIQVMLETIPAHGRANWVLMARRRCVGAVASACRASAATCEVDRTRRSEPDPGSSGVRRGVT
jgi:hypothetical protein